MMPTSEYKELEGEYVKLHEDNLLLKERVSLLEAEVEFLKNGAPKLLQEIKQLYSDDLWDKIIPVYVKLRNNFPNTSELKQAELIYEKILPELAWRKANKANSIDALKEFIENHPKNPHVSEAKTRIAQIKQEEFESKLAEAKQKDSKYGWETFLETYPDYRDKNKVKRRIIELEVDEIMGDANTGKLPRSNKTQSSSSTRMSIFNQTGNPLILRYAGPTVIKIIIPAYGTRNVNLRSGHYRVAASSGNLNYAGSENLSGIYDVKYYITTRRY